ncbi:MAG: AraC family transcriptional regulator [Bacteroidetes bacterium B1(2017)]|nr:MAG: AraC family transcriptional regulator [Bacteroidetes bacterium B1(2017)]
MKLSIIKSIFFVIAIGTLLSFDLPNNWFKAGSNPECYEMGIDKGVGPEGKNAATIKSAGKKVKGFGTLMQSCLAEKYLGKKIKMSGYVKSTDVKGWAGLWLRVDDDATNRAMAFDNMQNRPIVKTTDWKKYEIVLDVPFKADGLAYGALLVGKGQIWFSDITFEIIGDIVPLGTKECIVCTKKLKEPSNLNFTE